VISQNLKHTFESKNTKINTKNMSNLSKSKSKNINKILRLIATSFGCILIFLSLISVFVSPLAVMFFFISGSLCLPIVQSEISHKLKRNINSFVYIPVVMIMVSIAITNLPKTTHSIKQAKSDQTIIATLGSSSATNASSLLESQSTISEKMLQKQNQEEKIRLEEQKQKEYQENAQKVEKEKLAQEEKIKKDQIAKEETKKLEEQKTLSKNQEILDEKKVVPTPQPISKPIQRDYIPDQTIIIETPKQVLPDPKAVTNPQSDEIQQQTMVSSQVATLPIISSSVNQVPTNGLIKKSNSGKCHSPNSTYYSRTGSKNTYSTMDDCVKSGGTIYM
jgi:hypothetical protein